MKSDTRNSVPWFQMEFSLFFIIIFLPFSFHLICFLWATYILKTIIHHAYAALICSVIIISATVSSKRSWKHMEIDFIYSYEQQTTLELNWNMFSITKNICKISLVSKRVKLNWVCEFSRINQIPSLYSRIINVYCLGGK